MGEEIDVEVEIGSRVGREDSVITVPTPAAGGVVAYTVTRTMRLRSVSALFTASNAIANRLPRLTIKFSDGQTAAVLPLGTAVTASQAVQLTWAKGASPIASSVAQAAGMPDYNLTRGAVIEIEVGAEDAADALSAMTIVAHFLD